MSVDTLKARLKSGNLSGAYLLYGQEEYTKDYYADILRNAVEKAPMPEFNRTVVDMKSSTFSDLYEACNALPFMAERRLIEVKELDIAAIGADDAQLFSDILNDLPDYVIMLMLFRSDKLDAKQLAPKEKSKAHLPALISLIASKGAVAQFDRATPAELVVWLTRHFNAAKIKPLQGVPQRMIDMCGDDMYVLHSETAKLCSACAEQGEVTLDDVARICCANDSYAVYDLANLITERNFAKADKVLSTLLAAKLASPQLLSTLAKRFSELATVKAALESATPASAIAQKLKLGDWVVRRYIAAVSRTDSKYLTFVVREIYNADVKMKQSAEDKDTVLKLLLARIAAYES